MSSTRFVPDPDRIFPDHAYAPGYEPAPRDPIPEGPEERIIGGGELLRFAAAALMAGALLALVSALLMAR